MSGIFGFTYHNKDKLVYPQPYGAMSALGYKITQFITAHSSEKLQDIATRLTLVKIDDEDFPVSVETQGRAKSLKYLAHVPSDTLFKWLSEDLSVLVQLPETISTEDFEKFVYLIDLDQDILTIKIPLTKTKHHAIIEITFADLREKMPGWATSFEFEAWVYEEAERQERQKAENVLSPVETSLKTLGLEEVIESALFKWESETGMLGRKP
jgi:hypothetical protein